MKRVLIVATVVGFVQAFLHSDIVLLQEAGFEVHIAANMREAREGVLENFERKGCVLHPIPFDRTPFSLAIFRANRALKRVLAAERFDFVYCHTPVGGVVGRLAAAKYRKRGTKVIYVAHGFHFYCGASKRNWLTFYPIEKYLSARTDALVTINREDYARAQDKFKRARVYYIPGVGVDTAKLAGSTADRAHMRAGLGVGEDDILLLSVGELNLNKNHAQAVLALPELPANVRYAVAGEGGEQAPLQALAEKLGVSDRFRLLGYRRDISDLLRCADVFVFPSKREGLSVSLMEAMANGLPIAASRIRGNVDLVEEGRGGYLCERGDGTAWVSALRRLSCDAEERAAFAEFNRNKIKAFELTVVRERMRVIFAETLGALWTEHDAD